MSLYCFHDAGFTAAGFVSLSFPPTAIWVDGFVPYRVRHLSLNLFLFSDLGVTANLCLVPKCSFVHMLFVRKFLFSSSGRTQFIFRDAKLIAASDPTSKFVSWRVDSSCL